MSHPYWAKDAGAPDTRSFLMTLPAQIVVLDTLAEFSRTVSSVVHDGGHVVVSLDNSRKGVWVQRTSSTQVRALPNEPVFHVLNTLQNLSVLAQSAEPLCARPDSAKNGMWIVPADDVSPLERTALRTLEEMQLMASGLSGALVLVDGDTAVLHRLVYFLRHETEEIVYRAVAVCSTMCSHAHPRVEDALRLQPGLIHALHAAGSPEGYTQPERTKTLAREVLCSLGATHPSCLDRFPEFNEHPRRAIDAMYSRGSIHPGLTQDNALLQSENLRLLAERDLLLRELRDSQGARWPHHTGCF